MMINEDSSRINGNNVTVTLSWGEPSSYFAPIISYTVSCSGDAQCPPNFTTTDSTTRSYTITNLIPMTNYTFSIVAISYFGNGEAGVLGYFTPGEDIGLIKPGIFWPACEISFMWVMCMICVSIPDGTYIYVNN